MTQINGLRVLPSGWKAIPSDNAEIYLVVLIDMKGQLCDDFSVGLRLETVPSLYQELFNILKHISPSCKTIEKHFLCLITEKRV